MIKRIFTLLLCLLLTGGIAACTAPGEPADPTDTNGTDAVGTNSADADSSGTDSEGKKTETETSVPWDGTLFDPEAEHQFLAADIKNHSIVIFDLNRCNGDLTKLTGRTCVVWEWDADKDKTCKIKPGAGIDAAKLRYSPYYKKDVIIACSSSGWAGVIDYEAKSVLWECMIGGGPHSIEMMPDSGDIVVAGSADEGLLAYVPLSPSASA